MNDKTDTTRMQLDDLNAAKTFLREQVSRERRSLKIRLVVGVVVSVIVFGYMFWLSSTLTSLGTPETIREAFVTTIRSNAPELVSMAKKQILGNKKDLVDFLTREGADKLVTVLIQEGEKSLDNLIARITNETIAELNEHFVKVLKDDDSRLHGLLAKPDSPHLEAEIVKAFDDDLQESMGQVNLDEDFNEPLSKKFEESLAHLNMINSRLKSLAESETLSRREVLMVRFIKSWSAYVQQAGDEESPEETRCHDGTRTTEPPPVCRDGKIRAIIEGRWACVNPGTCQP